MMILMNKKIKIKFAELLDICNLKIESKKMWWELKGCVRIEKIAMEISE